MIQTDTDSQELLEAKYRGLVYLAELDFKVQTIRFNSSAENLTIGGNVYTGLGNMVEWPSMKESEDSSPNKLTFRFSLVNQALLAATIGDATQYRHRKVRVYLQMMTPSFHQKGQPILRWRGYMDKVSTEKSKNDTGFAGVIKLDCTKPGLTRVRNYEGLKLTHEQHRLRYPNDRGLEYMQELVQTPQPWLTVDFQKIK